MAVLTDNCKILCKDSDGLKYFNESTQQWEKLNQLETEETFQTYGTDEMVSDTGLRNRYRILVYDPTDAFDRVDIDVTPPTQTVTTYIETNSSVNNINVDYEGNVSVYDMKVSVTKKTNAEHQTYKVKTTIEKKSISDNVFRLYMVSSDD